MSVAVQPSVCHIASLPDELLVAIASELRIERGFLNDTNAEERRVSNNAITTRGLSALVLTCRKFNAIATPLFYQCVIPPPQKRSRNLLLRTLINNPVLGQHIHYLEMDEEYSYGPDPNEQFDGLDADKVELLLQRTKWLMWSPDSTDPVVDIGTIENPLLKDPKGEFSRREIAALGADPLHLLVSFMDNLQEASVPESMCWHLAFRHTKRHERLRRLWIEGTSHLGLRSEYRAPVILSSTEGNLSVYLQGWTAGGFDSFLLQSAPYRHKLAARPPMKELILSVHEGDLWFINILLSGCGSLERFSCRWHWTDKLVQDFPVDLPKLHSSLCQVQDSLTHLTIDPSESAWLVGMDEIVPSMGSLRNFKALKYLEVTELVLWDDDESVDPPPLSAILPPSLETLIIKTEWDDDIGDALYQLGIDIPAFFPNLQSVECTWRPAPGPVAEELIKLFEASDVDLKLSIEDDIDSQASGS